MRSKGIELSNLGMRSSLFILCQELLLFSEALISYWSNRRFSDAFLAFQKENLWKAFDYFMKEEYPKDFLDLKLPSEEKKQVPSKAKRAGKKMLKRVKQLSLFMKKTVLRWIYNAIVSLEKMVNSFLGEEASQDFEDNRLRH
jgi:hypothetical protein